jgi:hypothetical protein
MTAFLAEGVENGRMTAEKGLTLTGPFEALDGQVWLKDLACGNSWLCCSLVLVALKRKDEAGEMQLAKEKSEKGLGGSIGVGHVVARFFTGN